MSFGFSASSSEKLRLPAVFCALTLPLCAVLVRPVAETGMYDDWSYIRTAQVLAQTGHVQYNGWATAMLGWQLVPAALLFRVFGFSFAMARLSTLFLSMATAFLSQRTFVRAGLSDWNASIGTLTLILTPLFLPLSFSFMTDIAGLLTVVV